jgi:uncharacterized membrane protein YfcA
MAILLALNPGKKGAPTSAQVSVDERISLNLNRPALFLGVGSSLIFGFVSSFLGIGGGFLYMPALVYLLKFPVHTAAATSLFVLTITAFAGSATHVAAGLFQHGVQRTIALSIGAIAGAQLAARVSPQIRSDWIIRSLALALGVVGLRLVMSS